MYTPTLSDPTVANLIEAIRDDLIGGAADMARETARAFAQLAGDESVPDGDFPGQFENSIKSIIQVTPSIMPVTRVLHTVAAAAESAPDDPRGAVVASSREFVEWLDGALDEIARIGADLIKDGDRLFLYSMSSTVYRMIEAALARGKSVSVVTTESRPTNEGHVTLERLCPQGVEVDIGVDVAMTQLMRDCTAVYVGSDDVTSAGDCLAKVGCYASALVARHYGIPYYIAGDTSKFDPSSLRGVPVKIREMEPELIVEGALPEHGRVRNPVFELVPAELVTAYVTELGILHPGAVSQVMSTVPWNDRVGGYVSEHNRG
jgi:translation initiation factor 2B subunit (eIF-2B alpha/beta/delta family)